MSQATIQSKFAWSLEFNDSNTDRQYLSCAAGLTPYFYVPADNDYTMVWVAAKNRFVSQFVRNTMSQEGDRAVSVAVGTEANAFIAAGLNAPPGFAVEIAIYYQTDIGDTTIWNFLNASGNHRYYINKFASYRGQFFVRDNAGTERTLQEGAGYGSFLGSWTHFVCSIQKGVSNPWYIYRNGVASAGTATSWTYGDIKPFTGWTTIQSGSRNVNTFDTAQMAFCRLYKDYIDADEVALLYNSGSWRTIDYVNTNWEQNFGGRQKKIRVNAGDATGSAYKWRDG